MNTDIRPQDAACPIAGLIDEVAANIELQARLRAEPEEECDTSYMISMLEDRLDAIQAFAETGRATSLTGVTLQVVLLHGVAGSMGDEMPDGPPVYGERNKRKLNRAADAVAYSALAALQANGGELPNVIVEYYMPPLTTDFA